MGATPSHENDIDADDPESSDDDDILKMQNGRFRVSFAICDDLSDYYIVSVAPKLFQYLLFLFLYIFARSHGMCSF